MAIGTAIGAVAGLAGSIIGGNSQNRAASRAADAQSQVARENNALALNLYNQNKATLAPYVNAGIPATNALNGLLGLGSAQQQAAGQQGFSNFLKGSDYAFQQATGNNALNSGYAGGGVLQSGAAMKELENYRQNLQSGYRGQYLNALGNQQGLGLGAASAQAGVGQNYTNTITANNQNAADALSNAALIRGQNNPFATLLGGVGGLLGGLG